MIQNTLDMDVIILQDKTTNIKVDIYKTKN